MKLTPVTCPTCGKVCANTTIARHRLTHDNPRALLTTSDELQAEIVALYARGYSLERIAREKYLARSSVRRILLVNGVKMRPQGGPNPQQRLSAEEQLKTAELYGKGLSMAELSEILGISISSVHLRLHNLGVKIRRPGGDHRSRAARARKAHRDALAR